MKVENLDVLRPESKFVKLDGKDIDVSFIPCGITFEIDDIVQELIKMNKEGIDTLDKEKQRRAFDLAIELCVAFCSRKYPEMDKKWFMDNVDPIQVKMFAGAVQDALFKSYSGIEVTGKNLKAPKKRK
jgi:hypothetical protein